MPASRPGASAAPFATHSSATRISIGISPRPRRPPEVRKLFKRTVPVGVEFGTIGVLDHNNVMHEVTTFRRDVQTDGRHAVVEFGASLDDDLARRDYTINAMAYSPSKDELRDPLRWANGSRREAHSRRRRSAGPDAGRSPARAARDSVRGAVRFRHRARHVGRDRRERARAVATLCRAREAGDREDDGPGAAAEQSIRDVARHGGLRRR